MDRNPELHHVNGTENNLTTNMRQQQLSRNLEPSTSAKDLPNSQAKNSRKRKRNLDNCEPSTSKINQSNRQAYNAERLNGSTENVEPSVSERDPFQQVKNSKSKRLQGLPLEKAEALRIKVNQQERDRQQTLNNAFDALRNLNMPYNPNVPGHKENSKYYLLVTAIARIRWLTKRLEEDDRSRNMDAPASSVSYPTNEENQFSSSSTAVVGSIQNHQSQGSSTAGFGSTVTQAPCISDNSVGNTDNQCPSSSTHGNVRNNFPSSSTTGYVVNQLPSLSTVGNVGYLSPSSSTPGSGNVRYQFPSFSTTGIRCGSLLNSQMTPGPIWPLRNLTNLQQPYRFVGHSHYNFSSSSSYQSNHYYTGQACGLLPPSQYDGMTTVNSTLVPVENHNYRRYIYASCDNISPNHRISNEQCFVAPPDARSSAPYFNVIHQAQNTTMMANSTLVATSQPNTSTNESESQIIQAQQSTTSYTDVLIIQNSDTEMNVITNKTHSQCAAASEDPDVDKMLTNIIDPLTIANVNFESNWLDDLVQLLDDHENDSIKENNPDSGIGSSQENSPDSFKLDNSNSEQSGYLNNPHSSTMNSCDIQVNPNNDTISQVRDQTFFEHVSLVLGDEFNSTLF